MRRLERELAFRGIRHDRLNNNLVTRNAGRTGVHQK
jgi:hypothetical protein